MSSFREMIDSISWARAKAFSFSRVMMLLIFSSIFSILSIKDVIKSVTLTCRVFTLFTNPFMVSSNISSLSCNIENYLSKTFLILKKFLFLRGAFFNTSSVFIDLDILSAL